MRYLVLASLIALGACAAQPVRVAQSDPDALPGAPNPLGICSYGCK